MRTVTYGAASSADGFIADSNGSVDWLHFSTDVQDIVREFWKPVDTVLLGRKTWEIAAAMATPRKRRASKTGTAGTSTKPRKSAAMPGIKATYVFSRTLTSIDQDDVQLVRDDAGEFVRQLKQQDGKDICVLGGGGLARSLFAAGVIDEVGFNMHPILLGSGVPLFLDAGCRIRLELKECRTIDGGCVLVTYRVVN
jgi:dihydrofolate reductase